MEGGWKTPPWSYTSQRSLVLMGLKHIFQLHVHTIFSIDCGNNKDFMEENRFQPNIQALTHLSNIIIIFYHISSVIDFSSENTDVLQDTRTLGT